MKSTFSGLPAWLVQRISAVVLLLCLLAVAGYLLSAPPPTPAAWRAAAGRPAVQFVVGLFFVAAALHAWVGARDIILDYLKPLFLRLAALSLVALGLAATVAWVTATLLKVA